MRILKSRAGRAVLGLWLRRRPAAFRRALVGLVLALSVSPVERASGAEEIPYQTRVTVRGDASLRTALLAVSRLQRLEVQPPASMGALRRRIERDLETFSTLLGAEGYYDHAIRYRLDTDEPPMKIRIRVDTGPAYNIAVFDVILRGDELEPAMQAVDRARKRLRLGEIGRAKIVIESEDAVLRELAKSGFPFPSRADREVVVDHAERSLTVRSIIDTGRRARFGATRIEGVEGPLANYAERRLPWKAGDLYDPTALDELRKRLSQTGLFSSVRVKPVAAVLEDGTLPMVIEIERAKMRSIGFGGNYSSSEGVGGQAFWEHRNLLGHAERLRVSGEVSEIGESGKLTFRRPDFLATNQDLVFESAYEIENTEAYDAQIFSTLLGLERPLGGFWRGRAGIEFQMGPIDEPRDDSRNVTLVGFPLGLRRDSSDDFLDPMKGTKLDIGLTPFSKELGSEASFLIGEIAEAVYFPVLPDRRLVAAGRAALGSISGAGRFVVPADRRFYAGGGGSVRGFAYQLAGPLDDDDDPTGGRSLIEFSGELRWRITKSFGVVPFVDAGSAFADEYPSFDRNLFWGAGLGLRYFSPVGPIRVDVATPLNPRSDVDDPVQFYLSLGQAF